jgi:hypothetical protein
MNGMEEGKQAKKDALKMLRGSRRQTIEEVSRRMKEQKKAMDAVRKALKEGPGTVPELSQTTGLETSQTLWIVAALKKYGEITEEDKDGSYFRYVIGEWVSR